MIFYLKRKLTSLFAGIGTSCMKLVLKKLNTFSFLFCFAFLQTIVELAETGSLDLSIFCSTCLVVCFF